MKSTEEGRRRGRQGEVNQNSKDSHEALLRRGVLWNPCIWEQSPIGHKFDEGIKRQCTSPFMIDEICVKLYSCNFAYRKLKRGGSSMKGQRGRIHGYRSRVRVGLFEVTRPFGQEQWGQGNKIIKKSKVWRTNRPTDRPTDRRTKRVVESRARD